MNKLGDTGLTIVLLISLSLVALAVLWAALQSVLNAPNLSPDKLCAEMELDKPIEIENACYRFSSGEMEVLISRKKSDLPILNILFEIGESGSIKKWSCGLSCSQCSLLSQEEEKKYFFNVDESIVGQVLKLRVSHCYAEQVLITECVS